MAAGSGGGGYGGAGGKGGYDLGDNPGQGGATYGTSDGQTIEAGSSGGSSDNTLGGAGGGGVALRAAGHGQRVGVLQFIKGSWQTGEQLALARFPEIEHVACGEGFTWDTQDRARDIACARAGWERAKQMIESARSEQPARQHTQSGGGASGSRRGIPRAPEKHRQD